MPSFDTDMRGLRAGLARALLLALALCLPIAASASAAAPNWFEPADLSKSGRNAYNPAVAMDAAGNTIALWERQSFNPSHTIQVSTRAAAGTFTAPVDLSQQSTEPQLAITPGGEAVAVWKHFENPPGVNTIQIATRPAGGSFGPPETAYVAPSPVIPQEPRVAIGDHGDVIITWGEIDPESVFTDYPDVHCGTEPNPPNNPIKCPNPQFVMAAVRPAGGVFTGAQRISKLPAPKPEGEPGQEEWAKEESVKDASGARPTVDPAGNATVVFSYFDGEDNIVQSVYCPAGGSFAAPAQLSASTEDAGLAEIGVDAAGNAIASWARYDGSDTMVQAAIKPPGGAAFTPLGDISPAGETAEFPVLDVAPSGSATVVWRLHGTEDFLQSSTRPAAGAFGPPVSINSSKGNPQNHQVAVGDQGDAIVVWSGENGPDEIVRAAVRTAGSTAFGATAAISQSGDPLHQRPAMDAGGDATVVWERFNGTFRIVQWAGYDADPPQLDRVSIPSSATVGDTVQFSASASDVWPVGEPSFDFGDGGHADGSAVSHVYSAPRSYPVTVTVKDAIGKTATSAGAILVKARNHFKIGKLKRNRRKGTATLTVTIPEPGSLVASGKGMKKATVRAAKAGAVKVPIKAAGKGLKRLRAKGRLKLKLRIAYSPVGGDTSTQRYRLTLLKKLG